MNLMIVIAVIFSVFVDIYHSFVSAVERSKECSPLGISSTFYLNLVEGFLPYLFSAVFERLKIPFRNFIFQIGFGLIDADKRNPVFKFNRFNLFLFEFEPCNRFLSGGIGFFDQLGFILENG